MKKWLKNEVCGIRKQYTGALFTGEYSKVAAWKKKKKKLLKQENADTQCGSKPHLSCHKLLNDISKVVYFKKLVKILYNLAKPDFFEEVWIIRFFALKWKADKNL